MSRKIIFQGSAVQQETREFFLKMAKLAFDNDLNVELRETKSQRPGLYDAAGMGYQEDALNLTIYVEQDIMNVLIPEEPEPNP